MTPLEIMWIVFAVTATGLFVADIKLSAGRAHEIGRKEAMLLCAFWILVASVFGVLTGYMLGFDRMVEFFTAYTIEYSLSMDNMFVFIMIFSYFGVPAAYQHRVLFWGILGALVMRGIFIALGAAALYALWRHGAVRLAALATYLVTGGAGGIGSATARRLLGEGACVVLADIDQSDIDFLESLYA